MAEAKLTDLRFSAAALRIHAKDGDFSTEDRGWIQATARLLDDAAKTITSLQAAVANAEERYDASEARNEFLTSVIEAIEQAAKEAKELPK